MTSPNGSIPPGSAQTGSSSSSGLAGFAAKTGDQWKAENTNAFASSYEGPFGFWGKLITNLFGGIFNGLSGFASLLFGMISGTSGGSILDLGAALLGIKSQAQLAKDASDAATAQAQGALNAATAADKKVTSLIQGGVRTVYTSNTTYTPGPDVFRIVVLLYGGGANGSNAAFSSPGGLPGGVITADIPRSGFPTDGFSIVIGASGQPTTCGPFSSANNGGGGQITNSTLIALASSVFPGAGGRSGVGVANGGNGTAGGSTSLAAGGNGAGGVGGNAAVDGQYLAGGGGGGGISSSNQFGPATNGGAGGFPGGGGGGAGRNGNEAYWVGGIGAPGLCAIIEFKAAAA